jgi:hypothetical protein
MNELVLNFVNQYKHPFTAELAAEMTAVELDRVKPVLADLLADKTIKLISVEEGIYVRSNRYNPIVGYGHKSDWRFDQEAALILLNLIEAGNYSSVRKIAAAFGRSRQWVFLYMEALASIGIIGMSDKIYTVITRSNLEDIGKHIEQGILGRMRRVVSSEQKQINQEQKELRRQQRAIRLIEAEERQKLIDYETARKAAFIKDWNEYLLSGTAVYQNFQAYLNKRITPQQ